MKKKSSILSICSILMLSTLIMALFLNSSMNFCNLIVYAYGTPDALDNVISWLAIYQWNTTSVAYDLLQNVTTNTPWTQRVNADLPINFTMQILLNATLASSNAEAISYTRVYGNISNGGIIWNTAEFNNTAVSTNGTYYFLEEQGHWNQSGYPVAGTDYDVEIWYDAYY